MLIASGHSDILEKSMPFLADPTIGVIGGPKLTPEFEPNMGNSNGKKLSQVCESSSVRESKSGSTPFFEGGFCAFKKNAIERFDPYSTGSDDCGTVIRVIENDYRAMLVPEAMFYSMFPLTLRNKLSVKLRRINQLIRVFAKYFHLVIKENSNLPKSP